MKKLRGAFPSELDGSDDSVHVFRGGGVGKDYISPDVTSEQLARAGRPPLRAPGPEPDEEEQTDMKADEDDVAEPNPFNANSIALGIL